jgi:gas vesicle protein
MRRVEVGPGAPLALLMNMNEHSKVVAGAIVGAVVGAAATYLFLTDQGRTLRERLEPAIDEARSEFSKFQGTLVRAAAVVNDGVRLVQEFGQRQAASQASSYSEGIQ